MFSLYVQEDPDAEAEDDNILSDKVLFFNGQPVTNAWIYIEVLRGNALTSWFKKALGCPVDTWISWKLRRLYSIISA